MDVCSRCKGCTATETYMFHDRSANRSLHSLCRLSIEVHQNPKEDKDSAPRWVCYHDHSIIYDHGSSWTKQLWNCIGFAVKHIINLGKGFVLTEGQTRGQNAPIRDILYDDPFPATRQDFDDNLARIRLGILPSGTDLRIFRPLEQKCHSDRGNPLDTEEGR